jgi:uncharacterized protein YxjI
MTTQPPPGWYPDPSGEFDERYWDGAKWSEQTRPKPTSAGLTEPPPAATPGVVPTTSATPDRIERQVAKAGGGTEAGGGTLFTEPILVVNQKTKLIEVNNEYAVYDQAGNQIGAVRQVGQSALKKIVRVLGDMDQFFTHVLEVVDADGAVQMTLTRPRKILKSRVEIAGPDGRAIGTIKQLNAIGKIRFSMEANGTVVGYLNAQNWRAWNFSITDHSGNEVAVISKSWEGLARTLFTTADRYVVRIHSPLAEPLRTMVVASAVSVDTALKQDNRGFN